MQYETTLLFWWLNILNKKRYDQLRAQCGSLDTALQRLSPALLQGLGLRDDTIKKVFVRIEEFDAEKEIGYLEKAGVSVLSLEDERYPRLLRETADPPVFLSYRGDLSVLEHPCVALVGTRDMTPYGERLAEWIVPPLVQARCTTVSGLAFGIDAVIAQTTLDCDGKTVAVLGSGLGAVSPKTNDRLATLIVQKGGLLLSEYPFTEVAQPFMFPARNRIVAGLSLATVVVEAPAESGALITARLALEENRDVYAFPGDVFQSSMEGNHRLIAQSQAQLLRSPEDVLRGVGVVMPQSSGERSATFASDDEAAIYALVTTLPISVDDLVSRSGKTAGEIASILTMLEIGGAVAKYGDGWVRT